MKPVRIAAILIGGYLAVVVAFELVVTTVQPDMDIGIVLTTTSSEGKPSDRKLAGVRVDDHLYVAANHWPRPWYHRALANPAVEVTEKGERRPYTAVSVADAAELARIGEQYHFPFVLRVLTGFPPRRYLRLDPR